MGRQLLPPSLPSTYARRRARERARLPAPPHARVRGMTRAPARGASRPARAVPGISVADGAAGRPCPSRQRASPLRSAQRAPKPRTRTTTTEAATLGSPRTRPSMRTRRHGAWARARNPTDGRARARMRGGADDAQQRELRRAQSWCVRAFPLSAHSTHGSRGQGCHRPIDPTPRTRNRQRDPIDPNEPVVKPTQVAKPDEVGNQQRVGICTQLCVCVWIR